MVNNLPAIQETQVWFLGQEDPHYSCLKNSMNRGAWRATVHGVEKSRTRLSTNFLTVIESRNIDGFEKYYKKFPGSPVVRTAHFPYFWGQRFDLW